jgi:hypothetical protein
MVWPYRSLYSGPQDRKISAIPGMVALQMGHEAIQGFGKGMKALVRQMGVEGRRLGAFMSQEFLDHPQADASLQKVRRIGMAQGMD